MGVVVLGCALYAGRRAVDAVAGLEIFHVDRIHVRGNHRLSNGEVLALVADLRGRSIFAVDLEEWRHVLLKSPWVADASLRRTLPSTVDVAILERTPLGIGRISGALYLVDERGVVIDEYGPNYADLDLPIIDGLSGHPDSQPTAQSPRGGGPGSQPTAQSSRGGGPGAGAALGTPAGHPSAGAALGAPAAAPGDESTDIYRALLVRRLLDALRVQNMAERISQIDVSDARNAVVLLEGDPTLIRLGNERFAERLQSYFELAPALRERVPAIDYVDLRFDQRVYVRPSKDRPRTGTKTTPKAGRPTQTG